MQPPSEETLVEAIVAISAAVEKLAKSEAAIEQMLEDRRQFFYDHSLLRAYASREYWEARNKDIP